MQILFQYLIGRTENNREKYQDCLFSRRLWNQVPNPAQQNVSLRLSVLRLCHIKIVTQ